MKKIFMVLMVLAFVSTVPHVSFASDVPTTDKAAAYDIVHSDNVVILNTSEMVISNSDGDLTGPTVIKNRDIEAVGFYLNIPKVTNYFSDPVGEVNTIAYNSELLETLRIRYRKE